MRTIIGRIIERATRSRRASANLRRSLEQASRRRVARTLGLA